MNDFVLDSSILLAILNDEPGRAVAEELVTPGCFMSVVNLSEVVAKLRDKGVAEQDVESAVASFDLQVLEFTLAQAWDAGFLRPLTSHRGLSLGDRSCLALARELRTTALTADRPWRDVDVGVEIRLIR